MIDASAEGADAFTVALSPAFLFSCTAVVCSPGPDTLLIVRIVSRARRRAPALTAASGMLLAGAGYAALTVTGFLALAAAHPEIFLAWRVAGALLLLVIGFRALRDAAAPSTGVRDSSVVGDTSTSDSSPKPAPNLPRHFLLGFFSTAGNPKVGLFLTAFLPQFLPSPQNDLSALPLLAAVYLAIGGVWLVLLTEIGYRIVGEGRSMPGQVGRPAAGSAFPVRAARAGNAVAGVVLMALAVGLLLSR